MQMPSSFLAWWNFTKPNTLILALSKRIWLLALTGLPPHIAHRLTSTSESKRKRKNGDYLATEGLVGVRRSGDVDIDKDLDKNYT